MKVELRKNEEEERNFWWQIYWFHLSYLQICLKLSIATVKPSNGFMICLSGLSSNTQFIITKNFQNKKHAGSCDKELMNQNTVPQLFSLSPSLKSYRSRKDWQEKI